MSCSMFGKNDVFVDVVSFVLTKPTCPRLWDPGPSVYAHACSASRVFCDEAWREHEVQQQGGAREYTG